jgi:hypothetical protein
MIEQDGYMGAEVSLNREFWQITKDPADRAFVKSYNEKSIFFTR